jgi:hypothetical protein
MRRAIEDVAETIRHRSIPVPFCGCTLWEGSLREIPANRLPKSGYEQPYGMIRLRGKMVSVHRVVYEAKHGPIPEGVQVLHTCDVRLCTNEDHLFAGDNESNILDKMVKDRGRKRLTLERAREIHSARQEGLTHSMISERFGVAQSTVSRILSGIRRPLAMPATQE